MQLLDTTPRRDATRPVPALVPRVTQVDKSFRQLELTATCRSEFAQPCEQLNYCKFENAYCISHVVFHSRASLESADISRKQISQQLQGESLLPR